MLMLCEQGWRESAFMAHKGIGRNRRKAGGRADFVGTLPRRCGDGDSRGAIMAGGIVAGTQGRL